MTLLELVRPAVRQMSAYSVPAPTGITVKLDANEHPYPLPEEVRSGLANVLAHCDLHRYPRADGGALGEALSEEHGVGRDQLVLGNGSDELIQLLCATFGQPRAGQDAPVVLFPTPTFSVFAIAAAATGARHIGVPAHPDFAVDGDAMERAIAEHQPNLVFLARPNNPTGWHLPGEQLLAWARMFPSVVFVSDEAYADYGASSAAGDLAEHPNLLVLRTLSKMGLAGLRVGYLLGQPHLCEQVNKVRSPYNVGGLNLVAAHHLLTEHRQVFSDRCAEVVKERARVFAALEQRPGCTPTPSEANFVLFRVHDATACWNHLASDGILVRNLDHGATSGCLRVTVGTPDENSRFLESMSRYEG